MRPKKPNKSKGLLVLVPIVVLFVLGVRFSFPDLKEWLDRTGRSISVSLIQPDSSKLKNENGLGEKVTGKVKGINSEEKNPQITGSVKAVEDEITENSLVFRLKVFFLDTIQAVSAKLDTDLSVGNDVIIGNNLEVGNDVTIDGAVTVVGDVTAPNVLYSLTAGTGITVAGDQDLTITNADTGSAQNIFKNFKIGSNTISAGSNTDTLTWQSGTGITLSNDGKTITIAASSSDLNVSGWNDDGTAVRLTTVTDNVGIGTATPGYKLHVVGTSYFSGNATFAGGTVISSGIDNSSGGITNAGPITGATGLTSSGTITFSGLSTGILHSNVNGVVSSSAVNLANSDVTGILSVTNGGTGLATFNTGDILYASAANTLTALGAGAEGEVLTISSGIPDWGSSGSGSPCATCIVNNPGSTQTITPSAATAVGLVVKQASGGSVDVFRIESNDGSSVFLKIDSSGNVTLGNQTSSGVFTVSPSSTDPISISPVAQGAGQFTGTITSADLSANRTWTFPNESGVICLASGNCSGTSASIGGSGTTNYIAKWSSTYGLTDSIVYDDGTNIGIGTTTLLSKFHVAGSLRATGNTTLGGDLSLAGHATVSGSLTTDQYVDFNSTLGVSGATTLGSTLDVTGLATFGGNVGIGSAAPTASLDTAGDIVVGGSDLYLGSTSGIKFERASDTELRLYTSGNVEQFRITSSNIFSLGNSLIFNSSGTAVGRMTLDTDQASTIGFVIRGITSQTADLMQIRSTSSASDGDLFAFTAGGNLGIGSASPIGKLNVNGAATGKALTIINETGGQAIFVASASGTNRFIIQNDGNVGIANSTPSYKLDVTGTGRFTSVLYSDGGINTSTGNLSIDSAGGTTTIADRTVVSGDQLQLSTAGTAYVNATTGALSLSSASSGVYISPLGSARALYSNPEIRLLNISTSLGASYGVQALSDATTRIPLAVKGFAAQTANLFEWRDSDNVLFGSIDFAGKLAVGSTAPVGLLNASGAAKGKALTILNEAGDQAILSASSSGATKFLLENDGDIGLVAGAGIYSLTNAHTGLTIEDASGNSLMTFDTTDRGVIVHNGSASIAPFKIEGSTSTRYTSWSYNTNIQTSRYDDNSLTNRIVLSNAAGTGAGHGAGLAFNLGYSGTEVLGGRITNVLEGAWSATATTQDSAMVFYTTLNGTNAEKVRINSAGNVGIGTSDPVGLLHATGASTGKALAILNEAGDQAILVASASGTNRFTITNAGNVGIGTSTPIHALEVNGNIAVEQFLYHRGDTDTFFRFGADQWQVSAGGAEFVEFSEGVTDITMFNYNNADIDFRVDGDTNDGVFFVDGALENIGIGTTVPGAKLHLAADAADYAAEIYNDGDATTRAGLLIQAGLDDQTAAGPSTLIQFNDGDGGAVGSITFGSSLTSYNTTSDARLKNDFGQTNRGLTDLMNIQVHDYAFKEDGKQTIHTGFMAQELYQIYPDAVTAYIDDHSKYWQIDYGKLTPLLVRSIQEQNAQIQNLSLRLDEAGDIVSQTGEKTDGTQTQAVVQDVSNQEQQNTLTLPELVATYASITDTVWSFISQVQFEAKVVFKNTVEYLSTVVFKDTVVIEGTLVLNENHAGTVLLPSGKRGVKVTFSQALSTVPVVTVTPTSNIMGTYWISETTTTGFTVEVSQAQDESVVLNWQVAVVEPASGVAVESIDFFEQVEQADSTQEVNDAAVVLSASDSANPTDTAEVP